MSTSARGSARRWPCVGFLAPRAADRGHALPALGVSWYSARAIYVDDLSVNASSVTNFSGNPGFESGTSGWFTFGGGLSQSSTFAHSGGFSGLNSGRSASFNGPAFSFPTGAGKYSASLWALQNSGSSLPFVLSVKTHCNGVDNFPFLGQVNAASGTWVQLSGTFTVPANCTEVTLFLNQNGGSTFPDMYVDDLVALPILP